MEPANLRDAGDRVVGEEPIVRFTPTIDGQDAAPVVKAKRSDRDPAQEGDLADGPTPPPADHSAQQLIFSTSLKKESAAILRASDIVG